MKTGKNQAAKILDKNFFCGGCGTGGGGVNGHYISGRAFNNKISIPTKTNCKMEPNPNPRP